MDNLNEQLSLYDPERMINVNSTTIFTYDTNEVIDYRDFAVELIPVTMKLANQRNEPLFGSLFNLSAIKEVISELPKALKLLKETPKQNQPRDFFDLPEAANYLGIGRSTLRKALSERLIIGDRVGRKWRFSKTQLDKYIRRGKSDAEIDAEVENTILSNKRKGR
jgi:excisionase family DNA binding protein